MTLGPEGEPTPQEAMDEDEPLKPAELAQEPEYTTLKCGLQIEKYVEDEEPHYKMSVVTDEPKAQQFIGGSLKQIRESYPNVDPDEVLSIVAESILTASPKTRLGRLLETDKARGKLEHNPWQKYHSSPLIDDIARTIQTTAMELNARKQREEIVEGLKRAA